MGYQNLHSYFLEVDLDIDSSPSVSPKNLKVLLEPFEDTFFMLVDFVLEIVDLRSIVDVSDGS